MSKITISSNNINSATTLIDSSNIITAPIYSACCTITSDWSYAFKKRYYKCEYCDTLHETKFGVCDRCGAPLSNAAEV